MSRALKLAFTMFCLCASLYSISQWLGANVTPESEAVQRVKLLKQLTNGTNEPALQQEIDQLSDEQVEQALHGDTTQLLQQLQQDEQFRTLVEQLRSEQ